MGKLEDMALLVAVAEAGGLSAAGRRLSLSPATMTARLKAMEERYQTRLFHRSTRAITLTNAGEDFYHAARRVLEEARHAESLLTQKERVLSGDIRLSAPSDFGRQYLSPAIVDFTRRHPEVTFSVYLGERVEDLVANRLDMSIRVGNLPDSSLAIRHIRPNHRVLVASTDYLAARGMPASPEALHHHRCLALERHGVVMNEWRFEEAGKEQVIRVTPAMVCDDGALLRQWALSGAGIAGKSWWDVKRDVEEGRLQVLFADRFTGFSRLDRKEVGLQFVFPQRKLQPPQVSAFMAFFIDWLEESSPSSARRK
ncbi:MULTISPECIES: LysR family transcriptional regulator [Klebsiella]|uniref:LysR family transcriptional regulator n=2 Tax=Klebsiella pneumoniae complex TaxID=3390273 RepID=A0A486D153_KLEPN|nr:LysR family transcriptional regulator [Klebsiella quasipneumoniae]VGL88017.1 LysR family transcriptional regulator [Klebsiella pneumoniae]HCI4218405.1 LysR family transcriptional regulator [Klebsiella quasipneumoniae subsp. quasipneumoniae]SBI44793.1 LysR family transcriptional regulator [Klebsiella quasipneumoniae]VGG87099.1 LysR family transcriptional regulator [Klebsiella quasipneumoniae]HCI6832040.1 LysR family transcriptional regulator [Klebsiella quasipneumoniae subsp. quasipneumoniae